MKAGLFFVELCFDAFHCFMKYLISLSMAICPLVKHMGCIVLMGSFVFTSVQAQTVTETISSGYPLFVAFTPDGSKAYVTMETATRIQEINTSTNTYSLFSYGSLGATCVAFTSDGSKAYVATAYSTQIINTADNTVFASFVNGSGSGGWWCVALSPDNSKAYVTSESGGTVSVVNTSNNTITSTISVGSLPVRVVVSPDGRKVFVTNWGSGLDPVFQYRRYF
jgi:YVTN family beta-propeller protein